MQPPYDAALWEAVRIRMSPPNRESVAEIARDTGITPQTTDQQTSKAANGVVRRPQAAAPNPVAAAPAVPRQSG
jgi:hypothetical protein